MIAEGKYASFETCLGIRNIFDGANRFVIGIKVNTKMFALLNALVFY